MLSLTISGRIGKRATSLIARACLLMLSGAALRAAGAQGVVQCSAVPKAGLPADVYLPLDSWVYPALDRLHGLGYLDTAFLGIRPWTRRSIQRMIADAAQESGIEKNLQALELLASLRREFGGEDDDDASNLT
ncbi:MAG TPA: hypothetical protein VGU23_09555, partial [Acidobacteriaceae bacterium]|nr:hypothetical protein [Acidobacteriaceae bacterium]